MALDLKFKVVLCQKNVCYFIKYLAIMVTFFRRLYGDSPFWYVPWIHGEEYMKYFSEMFFFL